MPYHTGVTGLSVNDRSHDGNRVTPSPTVLHQLEPVTDMTVRDGQELALTRISPWSG